MALELITGRSGTPHVDSADIGAFNASTVSRGVMVLYGLTATTPTSNTVNIAAGELLCEGRHVRVTGGGETLTIDNGVSGSKRNDIVAIHYTRNSSGIESVSMVVIKGAQTSGTPTDPAMPNAGKVLNGAADAYWPIYRVPIDGLTPQTPVAIADKGRHVIARGKSGIWNWEKWSDGTAVCWGQKDYGSLTTNEAWYGLYLTHGIRTTFPFAFAEKPTSLITPSAGLSSAFYITEFEQTVTETQSVQLARPNSAPVGPCVMSYVAYGRVS